MAFYEDFLKMQKRMAAESQSSDESSGEQIDEPARPKKKTKDDTNTSENNDNDDLENSDHAMEDWFSDGSEFSVDESRLAPGLLHFVPSSQSIKIGQTTISASDRQEALKRFAAKYSRVLADHEGQETKNDSEDDAKEHECPPADEKKRFDIIEFYENDPETKWFDPNFVKRRCDEIGIRDDLASLWMDPSVWGPDYWNRRGFTKDSNAYPSLLKQFVKVCERAWQAGRDRENKAKVVAMQPRSVQQSRSKISRSSTHPMKGVSSSSKHNIGKHLHRSQSDVDTSAAKKASKRMSSSSNRKRGLDGSDHDNPTKRRRKSRWGDRRTEGGKR